MNREQQQPTMTDGKLAFEQWAHLYEVKHPDSPPVSFTAKLAFLAGYDAALAAKPCADCTHEMELQHVCEACGYREGAA
jgi:hypothetical protein